jgi:tripartite-type tricarboxylate transporter receptor subunit TctC
MSNSRITRRTAVLGLGLSAVLSAQAQAQPFPSRTIKIMVGFAAGGATDAVARIYANKLTELLGASVIVDNKPGAMQLLAARPTMSSAPDGYTLWLATSSSLVQSAGVREDMPFDPVKSFTHLARVADVDGIFAVRAGMGINSVRELIAYARANPGKLNYGSAGVGSGSMLAHAGNPKLKMIGVTGSQRLATLPDVPTVADSGVEEVKTLGGYLFYGLVGPANMPAALVQTINEAVNKASRSPDVAAQMEKQFFRPAPGTPVEFRDQVERELAIWKRVGKSVKLDN